MWGLGDEMIDQTLLIFQKRVKRCIEKLVSFKEYIYRCRSDEIFSYVDWYKDIINEFDEAVSLISQYNSLKVENLIKVKIIQREKYLENLMLEEIIVYINSILREIRDAYNYLDLFLRPNLSELEKGKIDLLRKDFENLETEDKIKKNLEIAINEAESGHELACGLISARVIVERLEKIEGSSDEERLAKLVELKIIDNTESSKFSSKAFLDASRSARNAVSHQNNWFPNGAESLSILTSAFRMTEWVSKYEKEVKNAK